MTPNFNYYCNKIEELEKKSLTESLCQTWSYDTTRRDTMRYRQLKYEDRIYIEVWQSQKINQSTIAKRLGVHRSTICRELRRGRGNFNFKYYFHLGEKHRHDNSKKRGRPLKRKSSTYPSGVRSVFL